MAQKYKIESTLTSNKVRKILPQKLQDEFSAVDEKYFEDENYWTSQKNNFANLNIDSKMLAQENLSNYKEKNINNIENDYQTDLQKINKEKAEKYEKTVSELTNLHNNAENSKNQLLEKAITKGWEHSSILEDGKKEIDKNLEHNIEITSRERTANLNVLNLKKTLLETEKDEALNNFNIAYASKLEKEIASIDKKMEDTKEKMQKSFEKADSNLKSISSTKQMEKTKFLINYLNGMSKQEALKFLNDEHDNIKTQIGESWSNNLQNMIKVRR